jgi:integrase/recombinase XerD
MAIKIVLRKRANSDGTRPLILQVIKDKQRSTIALGYSLKASDWDKKKQEVKSSYPNSVRLNKLILKKKLEAIGGALDLEADHGEASSMAIIKKLKRKDGSDFITQAEAYLDRLKQAGKYNQYTADKPRVAHFKEFLNDKRMRFPDITPAVLEEFKIHLADRETPLSERSIVNHLVVIRSVFSQAIKDGFTDKRFYPFGADKIRIKFPESNKIGLTVEEVKRLERAKLSAGSFQRHACNLWLISFYAAGMRISDVLRLKWSDIHNGRLHYVMGKNAKGGSVKLNEKAIAILEKYRKDKTSLNDFIFPDLKVVEDLSDKFLVQRRIAFTVSRIDKFLQTYVAPAAQIDKKLTMHIARHTFGNISGDKIPLQMLQKLYRHTSITTTIGYQANFIHKDADEAIEAVVGF